ncbi:hypothetical protein K4F52_001460 [Lecanicillium sp. MT-2017a]|nr:hypothetical protein K4F52_001460 [Lecanicillium sp. MT-2017a]
MSGELDLVYHDGHAQVHVVDTQSKATIYIADRSSSDFTLTSSPVDHEKYRGVGRAQFHITSSKIDLETLTGDVAMSKAGMLTHDFKVTSPNVNWRWERDGAVGSGIKLTDGGRELASFESKTFSRSTLGTFTIHNWPPPQDVLDLIVLTGLAKIEFNKRQDKKVAAAGIIGSNNG